MLEGLHSGPRQVQLDLQLPDLTWADVGVIGWLVDGAAIMNQIPLCRCSYGPYARAMVRVCKEESFHQRQGYEALLVMMKGTEAQKAMVQDAVNRWWWKCRHVRAAGCRQPQQRPGHALGHQAHQQRRPAPEVHRRHRAAGPGAGRDLPDPDLKWNEARGHYDYGQIDWAEFWNTVEGNGPCNKERLATRVKAHNDGQWVRDAALAYARKQQQRALKEAA